MQQATVEWTGGEAFRATTPSGNTLTLDGDAKAGPSPAEILLPALGACAGIDLVIILQKKRQHLKSVRATVEGERAGQPPRRWVRLKVHFTIAGDVTEEAVEHALELASTKYCSVAATIDKSATIEWSYSIQG